MFKTNPNESIHPEDLNNPPRLNYHSYGLTKREYFAAMAMQGFASSALMVRLIDQTPKDCTENAAIFSLDLADALIAELNKNEEQADTSR